MIRIKNTQRTVKINITELKRNIQKILDSLDYSDYDIGIWLCSKNTIHNYNKTYRNKDKPTDIISFPFYPELKAGERIDVTDPDEKNLGDILISPLYVKEDLPRWGVSFKLRMQHLLIHGICHLLGYDHIEDSDYKIMKKKEDELLTKLISE